MSRSRQAAHPDPLGRRRDDRRSARRGEGPQGRARARGAAVDHGARARATRSSSRAPTTSARTVRCTASPDRWSPTWSGRLRGLRPRARDRRRRLPRHRPGPVEARAPARLLAPGAVRSTRGRHVRGARSRPASRCAAATSSSSARSPPTSARSASPSPTRARASDTPTSACCAKPASRRSSERH